MKKVLLIVLIFVSLLGCSDQSSNTSQNDSSQTFADSSSEYLFADTTECWVSVKLPLNAELNNKHKILIEEFVCSKIFEFIEETISLSRETEKHFCDSVEDYKHYIEIESDLAYSSENIVSVIFTGLFNEKNSAHPQQLFFTLNFNPKTLKTVYFTEKYLLDDELYNNFCRQAEKNLLEEMDGKLPESWGDFSKILCDRKNFFEGIKNEGTSSSFICCYYTVNGVGFSYPVVYALGGHKEVELSYDLLDKTGDG